MLEKTPRQRLGRFFFALAACATIASTSAPRALAEPTKTVLAEVDPAPTLRKGVVVVGVGDAAAESTWPVAGAIYGDVSLRPKLEDRDARALAGAPPDGDAPAPTTELAALRAKISGDDPASLALLSEVAKRTSARAVVVVFPAHDAEPTRARLFDAADAHLEPTKYEADAKHPSAPWLALVDALHARYAPTPATSITPKGETSSKGETPKKEDGGSFLSSAWFWGALGAAALLGGITYFVARDQNQGQPSPIRIEWK